MPKQTCSRCDDDLTRPHTNNANYVRSIEFGGTEPREVYYAMTHTKETTKLLDELNKQVDEKSRQEIAGESAHPDAAEKIEVSNGTKIVEENGGEVETANIQEIPFSIPVEKFNHTIVESPNVVQDDDSVALTYTNVEEKEIPKTGLICPHCTKDEDEIIWGTDA